MTNREIVVASIVSLFLPVASAAAAGYHCNVHENRQIYPSRAAAESGTPPATTISLRNECFAEPSQRVPWPICQSINEPAMIYSDRSSPAACALGYVELGRCEYAQKYYTAEVLPPGQSQNQQHQSLIRHSFVFHTGVCEPCAHDVTSSVLGCKALCRRYFTGRYFDKDNDSQHDGGSWTRQTARITFPSGPVVPTLDEFRVSDENSPGETQCLASQCPSPTNVQTCQLQTGSCGPFGATKFPTAMEVCERRCGPPNYENPGAPNDLTGQQWINPGDNWWYVNYQRWNPNERLDKWLRSYNNVPDRPDPPAGECETLVARYCGFLDDTYPSSGPNAFTSGAKVQCKKNLLLSTVQVEVNGQPLVAGERYDFTGQKFDFTYLTEGSPWRSDDKVALNNDGFCDHLRRGNNFCSQTCSLPGDGFSNPWHKCRNAGLLNWIDDPLGHEYPGTCIPPALLDPGVPPGLPGERPSDDRRGGAVCGVKGWDDYLDGLDGPPGHDFTDPDISDPNEPGLDTGAHYYVATITDPAKAITTGSPTPVSGSSVTLHLAYHDHDDMTATHGEIDVARAVWRAERIDTGASVGSGDLSYEESESEWRASVTGLASPGVAYRIVVTFTDSLLRTSGDAIDVLRTDP